MLKTLFDFKRSALTHHTALPRDLKMHPAILGALNQLGLSLSTALGRGKLLGRALFSHYNPRVVSNARNFLFFPLAPKSHAPNRVGRCVTALAFGIIDVAAALLCFQLGFLGVFGDERNLSFQMLDESKRVYVLHLPQSLILATTLIGAVGVLGRNWFAPLIHRLGQKRRPRWWLVVYLVGAALFVSPYLLAAFGVPLSSFAHLTTHLLILGATTMGVGLLFWLALRPRHILIAATFLPTLSAIRWVQDVSWDSSIVQAATINTAASLLKVLGESVRLDPGQPSIAIGDFGVNVGSACSGITGMVMVSAVMVGYILASSKRLHMGRALILIPMAAGLSWTLNAVRITVLLLIGAHVSPQLAVDGFHTNAGWIAFCVLSAVMLVVAENWSWMLRQMPRPASAATSLSTDPAVSQIAPFVVLLLSSLLSGAIFVQPEAGYPLRFFLMAAALFFVRHNYFTEILPVDAVPIVAGALVALVWLGANSGDSSLTLTDILGPASQGAAIQGNRVNGVMPQRGLRGSRHPMPQLSASFGVNPYLAPYG